jgi:uncharacterized protein (DUF58 family)
MFKRALAVLVLVIVAVIAIRIVIGFVSAVLWIVVLAALAVAALWAWSTLKSAKRDRAVKKGSPGHEVAAAPAEDPVAVEMRRITEELRERQR